jgi:hypothetical protein
LFLFKSINVTYYYNKSLSFFQNTLTHLCRPETKFYNQISNSFNFQVRSQNCKNGLLISSCLSLCPSVRPFSPPSVWNNGVPAGRILKIKILYFNILRRIVKKIQDLVKSKKNKGNLHEDRHTLFIISHSAPLRMITFQTNFVENTKNTLHFQ